MWQISENQHSYAMRRFMKKQTLQLICADMRLITTKLHVHIGKYIRVEMNICLLKIE